MRVAEVFTPFPAGRHPEDHRGYRGHHHRGHWAWDWRNRRRSWCWDD
jgi:hypothetical protein